MHPGTCDPATDYTLDANGQLQGRLTPACDFAGTAAVAANRIVVRATGTLTGPGCPGTTTVLGYIADLGANKHGLTWWDVQANGQSQSTSANQL
ncbi:MAG TPA: hypothetical protein VGF26_07515 [Ramlibacter sp.]